jgi:hypothetical protein
METPFETTLKKLLEDRKKCIPKKEKYETDTTHIPYDINKTIKVLKKHNGMVL